MKSYLAVSFLIIGVFVVDILAREPQQIRHEYRQPKVIPHGNVDATVLSRNMVPVSPVNQMIRHNQRVVEASNNVQELNAEVKRINTRVDELFRGGRQVEGGRLHFDSRPLRAQAEWPVPGRTVQSPLPLPRRH